MKLFHLLIIFSFYYFAFSQRPATKEDKNAQYGIKFRSVECENFDNSTAMFTFCFVKPLSRTVTSLNFGYEIFKPLNSIFIQIIAFFRYGNIYREILDTKVIDLCSAMNGADYNLFLKLVIDIISMTAPKLFHKCPYEGKAEFYNITMDTEIGKKWSIFPEGQYK